MKPINKKSTWLKSLASMIHCMIQLKKHIIKLMVLSVILSFFAIQQNLAQEWIQIGTDIDGEAAGDFSGSPASLSADGSIVAIGAPDNDGNGYRSGHVRVYQYNGTEWQQIGVDIDGEAAGDRSGCSVSLSADGSIVAIGASGNDENGIDAGHVRIYQYNGTDWEQIGSDIDGEAARDKSGFSVSLNEDGSILAIGATNNNGSGIRSGHVRIYQYSGTDWEQIGGDIDGEAADDRSGISVSLSADGSIVAIGASGNDGNGLYAGHVRIYQYSATDWEQIGADIDGDAAYDYWGTSVSLSANGSILAIGGYTDGGASSNNPPVRIYQYDVNTNNWEQTGSDIVGEAAGDNLGISLSLSANGSIIAIGAPLNDGNGIDAGHARVYQYNGVDWEQIGADIDGEEAGDWSGYSVSLSEDGSIVASGTHFNDGNGIDAGHVRVFISPIPTVTVEQAAGQSDPTGEGTINFTATFSETVTGFATGDVTLGGTAGATTAIVTGSGTTYNIAVSGMTNNGTVIASIAAGVCTDTDGYDNVASSSTDNEVTYDNTAPTVTVEQAAGQSDPTGEGTINFTATFSETVTGFATGDVTLGGTAGATTAIVTGSGSTYNIAVSGMTNNGTVIASIVAGVCSDAAGNGNLASTSTDNIVTYDSTAVCNEPVAPTGITGITVICPGGSTNLTIIGGTLNDATGWYWYTGGCGDIHVDTGTTFTVYPSTTTTYYVRAEGGCATPTSCATVTVVVQELSTQPSAAGSPETPYCAGSLSQITLSYSGGILASDAMAHWYDDESLSNEIATGNNVTISAPGVNSTYYVRFEGTCNTTDAVPLEVVVYPLPEINAGEDTTMTYGEILELSATNNSNFNYEWEPANMLSAPDIYNPVFTSNDQGAFPLTVTVTDENDCENSDDIEITVEPAVLKIYNAFTPNGDGINDFWVIENIELYENSKLKVFDRNNVLVFESTGYTNNWSGTFDKKNGKKLLPGTYFYVLDLGDSAAGTTKVYKGTVTILSKE